MKKSLLVLLFLAAVICLCGLFTINAFAAPGLLITNGTDANAHGSITVDDSSLAGESVSITVTPETNYGLDSLKVYKTDDPTTAVYVYTTSGFSFVMPEYPVTVEATFFSVSPVLDDPTGVFGTRYTEEIKALANAFGLSPKEVETFLNDWASDTANENVTMETVMTVPKTNGEARMYAVLNVLLYEDYFRTKSYQGSRINGLYSMLGDSTIHEYFAKAIDTFSAAPSDFGWLTFYQSMCAQMNIRFYNLTGDNYASFSGVYASLNDAKTTKPEAAKSSRDALYQTALWFSEQIGSPFSAAELSSATDRLIARMHKEKSFYHTAYYIYWDFTNYSYKDHDIVHEYAAEAFVFSLRVLPMINGGDRLEDTVGPVSVKPFLSTVLDDSDNYFWSFYELFNKLAEKDPDKIDGAIDYPLSTQLVSEETNILCEAVGLPQGNDSVFMLNYLYGFNLPVFVDPLGEEVNVDTYATFDGGAYAKSRGYVFQGFYTGKDGTGEKLTGTPKAFDNEFNSIVYYAYYKTSTGKTVITTPLDFASDSADRTTYATKTNGIQWISSVSADTQDTLVLDNVLFDVLNNGASPAIHVYGICTVEIIGEVEIIVRRNVHEGVEGEDVYGILHSHDDYNEVFTIKGSDKNAKLTVTMGDNIAGLLAGINGYYMAIENLNLYITTGKLTGLDDFYSIYNTAVYCGSQLTITDSTLHLVAGALEAGDKYSQSIAIHSYSRCVYMTDVNAYLSGMTGVFYHFNVECNGMDFYGSADYKANEADVKGEIVYVSRYSEGENEIYDEYRLRGAAPIRTIKTVVHYEAAIGETKYTTLAAAIEAAASGDTVKLLRDVVLTEEGIRIQEDDDIILDLNGYVLALSDRFSVYPLMTSYAPGLVGRSYILSIIENEGKLTVKDTGNQNNVHYIAIGSYNVVWLLTPGTEGFDVENLTYTDPYGNTDYDDNKSIKVSKIYGGILGPCGSEAITNNGTLVLESGTIARCGGGVTNGIYTYYDDDTVPVPTFTMNGGVITECERVARYTYSYHQMAYGCVSNKGIFIMNGGTIQNNSIFGVVTEIHEDRPNTSGIFKMYGGKIENNVGGVQMNEGSQIVLGNTVSIQKNKNAQGTDYNLSLAKDVTVSFDAEKPLKTDSKIGVTIVTAPTATAAVPVSVANTTDYTKTFVSDYDGYLVKAEENKTVLTLWKITGQPTKDTDYTVATNDDDVTYQWQKVLPDKVYGDDDVVTETPAEGDWKDAGKLLFLDSYDGTVEGNVFTSYASQYSNYLDLLFNKNLVKVGDVFYFTSETALKISTWGEEPAKLESLGNNQYRLTILMLDEVISLVPTDSSLTEAFTISNLLVHQSQALTGETKAKLGTVSEAGEYFCRVTRGNATLDSETVTAVTISFAGGEDLTGTAPADMYQLEGRKISLPANPFTKAGEAFCGWAFDDAKHAAGTAFTALGEDVTLTATFKPEIVLESKTYEYKFDETAHAYTLAGRDAALSDFVISYLVNGTWTENAPVAAGKYDVKITRAESEDFGPIDLLVEGGVVIKAVEMSSKVDEDTKKSDVIVSTEEGFPADVTVVVEVTVESSVESKIKDNELVDYYSISDEAVKLGKHEEVALVFDVKLIRTVNGVETEIQPEDIAPGTKIKVKMLIPAELDTSKITRILHVHTAGDIEEIPFDASKVDDNGYYEIEINRLSEFAFICETDCQLHWFMLGASVLFVALIAVLYLVCGKRKHDLFTILSCVVYGIVEAILFIFSASCSFCLIMLIVAVVLLLLAVLLFLANDLFKKKDKKAEPKGEEPKAAEASAEPLSLHDAIEQVNAASVTNLQITKASIAEFLQKKFGENVEVNCRANYISSGILPLADTHYKKIDGGKKCFIYVYELSGGQVFCLVRANATVASQIQKKHPSFVRSAYPKTKEQDWYTLLLDDTFASAADVFDTLTFVFENFSVTKKVLLTKPETQKDEKTGSV